MVIRKCKCGAEAFVFRERYDTRPHLRDRWFYVACSECDSQGHLQPDAVQAVNFWNGEEDGIQAGQILHMLPVR